MAVLPAAAAALFGIHGLFQYKWILGAAEMVLLAVEVFLLSGVKAGTGKGKADSRRQEERCLLYTSSAIPLLIVFYIELTSPGFFDLLYGTAAGRVVMTVCLGIYLGACSLSKRILEIRI